MKILEQISENSLILTPNRRLSAFLHKKYAALMVDQGKKSWPTLATLPITTWINLLWKNFTSDHFGHHPQVLETEAELFLWESVLKHSDENNYLLNIPNTAELAKSAFSLLEQWKVNYQKLENTENSLVFKKWVDAFIAKCKKLHVIDQATLVTKLCEEIKNNKINLPQNILLYGFAEISPRYKDLLTQCQAQGATVSLFQPENINLQSSRIELRDETEEITAMACWAKQKYLENPEQMIGCVIHNLEKLRDKILRIFSEVFCEENTFTLNHIELPFNISAGKPLAHYPIIFAAIHFLKLPKNTVAFAEWSFILRSSFIGGAETEKFARANYELTLRKRNLSNCSLHEIQDDYFRKQCPLLADHLLQFTQSLNQIQEFKLASDWLPVFNHLLNALGWPGDRSLTSPEYQVTQEWISLLSDFASLDHTLGKISYSQAVDYIIRLATARIFQVESPERNIQILGMLEAADLSFDALWVMGLDDSVWPPAPKPNPFIPYTLQRELQMPHATAERELTYCEELLTQLRRNTNEVIFSYAMQREDLHLRPSPLIADFPLIKLNFSTYHEKNSQVFTSKQEEEFVDSVAPVYSKEENIKGGTQILKLQAACPFHAFAEIRLHAKPIDDLYIGLTPAQRGEVMHKALEIIWQILIDHAALQSITDEDLQSLANESADKALKLILKNNHKRKRYITLECQRVTKLLLEWLQLEKQRAPFRVHALELEKTLNVNNLSIKVRIDRIDEISPGHYLIIDYKTSKDVNEKYWFGNRIDEPQLPLYCFYEENSIAGIAFAQINASKMSFKSVGQSDLTAHFITPLDKLREAETTDWIAQINQWKNSLRILASEFQQGVANVSPKYPVKTCEHCQLSGLCRVNQSC